MKHISRKRILLLSLITLFFCSFISSSFATTNHENNTFNKSIIDTSDSKTFQIETSIHLDTVENEPVYIALVLDTSASMKNKKDIWDSKNQKWISRFDATVQAFQSLVDQVPNHTFFSIYNYHQSAERLTNGFQPVYQENGTRNPIFSHDSDSWILDQTKFGKNTFIDLSRGLQLAYEDMSQLPESSKRYVIIINDSVDENQGESQAYATALKSPQSVQIPSIGYGQQAEIWSILLGHDNNVNIGSWSTDWKSTDIETGTGDGFPDAEWLLWTTQNPNLLAANGPASMTELHMITLSTMLNTQKTINYPVPSTLYNWWAFYREHQEDVPIENGNNVHYLYTMSLYDDTNVLLDEENHVIEHPASIYTFDLTSLSDNMNQFSASVQNSASTTISGIEYFNPATVQISDISFFENDHILSTDSVQYGLYDNQLKWAISNAEQGNTYRIRYLATVDDTTSENVIMGEGSYIQIGSSDPQELNTIQFPKKTSPTPTAVPSLTPEPTTAPTENPIPTLVPTSTPAPTETPIPTVVPTPTPKPTVTPTETPAPSAIPTTTPRPTSIPEPTIAPTIVPSPTATQAPKQVGPVLSIVEEPVTTAVNVNPPVNLTQSHQLPQATTSTLPQATNTVSPQTTNNPSVSKAEKIDQVETKQLKGKSLQVTTTRTAILVSPKESAKPNAYIKQGRQFKIVGATTNYFVIQYKVKDGINRKGYVSKNDVQVVSSKK